jgi:GLPGLI family protein
MSKILSILFFFVLLSSVHAQKFNPVVMAYKSLDKYDILDTAYMKCSYKLDYMTDSTNIKSIAKDSQILLIGESISKYYSHDALEYNLFVKSYLEKNKNAEEYPSKNNAGWTFEVFKNYPQGRMTVTDIGSILEDNYLYEEEIPVFNWKISGEIQTVLSYTCQKATTSFRGRDYVAWFTSDIPLPNGPWKFGGLPGLILKLYDTKENFMFECEGLEQLKEKELINYYKIDYNRIKRSELNKMYDRYHNNFTNYLNLLDIEVVITDPETNENVTNPPDFKIPYNPIELLE